MRRILFSLCLLLAIALPCQAQGDKAKPNTLTPKEIADGWILLFDGETTFGWVGDKWKVDNGELASPGTDIPLRSTCEFQDFYFHCEFRIEGDKRGRLSFGKYSDGKEKTGIALHNIGKGWHQVRLNTDRWGVAGGLESSDGKIYFPEDQIRRNVTDTVPLVFDGDGLRLRNIKLEPRTKDIESLKTQSIFNGMDLTGWKIFPGKKSKFAVVDGAINVKDGPGDLQTVGKYKDFILQLECISNGKHLNSGIFFRCRDNEYQNGYEAQIRNEFSEKPTQKYLVEDYDPKTNKLLAKKEIMSTAIDFGTGAIYRRVPARKQMSKDGAWFGMTIVAHGNHFATWVNGIQVADWTDNRPKSDNARTGCKLEAGHISIQGHDPTTDLSFRNFRIAEFK